MAGLLAGEVSYSESGVSSFSRSSNEKQDEGARWYFGRKEIEENSPSRLDNIDLKKETYLRKSYCTFLQDLGMRLKVPQVTIATAIIFCHRFFIRQSHARNDRRTIATVCMFLAGKVEETPRPLKDVIVVSYEIIHKKDPTTAQKIKQKEVYEQQKELILSGEKIVLSSLGFDFNVHHPYKPLVEAIKKFKVAQNALAQVAWNFVNDGLRTSLCLQFMPHHIAAGAIFLAAKFLKVKLPSDGEKVWWQEFDVTPRQLEDVSNQMLELYEQNRVPASQGSEVESSVGGGSSHHAGSRAVPARPAHEHSNSGNHGGSSKAAQNKSNDNGSGEAGSVITEQKVDRNIETKETLTENHLVPKSEPVVEAPGNYKAKRTSANLPAPKSEPIAEGPRNYKAERTGADLPSPRSEPIVEAPGNYKTERKGANLPAPKSEPVVEAPGKVKAEGTGPNFPEDKPRNVNTGDAPVSQSPKDLKLLRDKVKAKLEAKKSQGEKTRKKDLMDEDEDDLIERELEDVELAVDDYKDKQKKNSETNHMGTEKSKLLDEKKNLVGNTEEGEMVDGIYSAMPSRKRKMGSPGDNQLGGGKRRHDDTENVEECIKTSRGSSHGD